MATYKTPSPMIRTRLFLGLTSAIYGLGGLLYDHPSGVSGLVFFVKNGWMFPAALVVCGALMAFSALMQYFGETRRLCREFSAFVLVPAWIAIWYHSMQDGFPDTTTLIAPVYAAFAVWTWFAEAFDNQTKLGSRRAEE